MNWKKIWRATTNICLEIASAHSRTQLRSSHIYLYSYLSFFHIFIIIFFLDLLHLLRSPWRHSSSVREHHKRWISFAMTIVSLQLFPIFHRWRRQHIHTPPITIVDDFNLIQVIAENANVEWLNALSILSRHHITYHFISFSALELNGRARFCNFCKHWSGLGSWAFAFRRQICNFREI